MMDGSALVAKVDSTLRALLPLFRATPSLSKIEEGVINSWVEGAPSSGYACLYLISHTFGLGSEREAIVLLEQARPKFGMHDYFKLCDLAFSCFLGSSAERNVAIQQLNAWPKDGLSKRQLALLEVVSISV